MEKKELEDLRECVPCGVVLEQVGWHRKVNGGEARG
jgi:hypothetical protein